MKERIRHILKEESLKKTLIDMVQEGGVYSAEGLVGGVENLLEILNIETPMDYLYLFNDLEIVKDPEYHYEFEHQLNYMIHSTIPQLTPVFLDMSY